MHAHVADKENKEGKKQTKKNGKKKGVETAARRPWDGTTAGDGRRIRSPPLSALRERRRFSKEERCVATVTVAAGGHGEFESFECGPTPPLHSAASVAVA